MDIFWPVFSLGVVLVVGSVFFWRHRDRIAKFNADNVDAAFGRAGRPVRDASTGANMTFPAIGMMVVGVGAIAMSLLGADAF